MAYSQAGVELVWYGSCVAAAEKGVPKSLVLCRKITMA